MSKIPRKSNRSSRTKSKKLEQFSEDLEIRRHLLPIVKEALRSKSETEFLTAILAAIRMPPKMTVSQWADRERELSPESSAEPGKWHTERAEYLRGVMDSISDPGISRVVCMKGAQVGWTECINNVLGYYMEHDPTPILIIQPTLEAAEAWSKDRLGPMLRDTPALRDKVKEPKSRDSENTIRQKTFPGGRLSIIGANAPSGLAARPIRLVLADEVDRYELSAGQEGDPVTLASKRQQTFWNRKTLIGSTPVRTQTSVIYREWLRSDQRRFFVPCPECGQEQHLIWAQVRWDKTEDGDHLPDTAHYVCEGCGSIWDDLCRWDAIKRGQWQATNPDSKVAGFHIPGLLSTWLKLAEIVTEFLAVRKNATELQVWVNTVLGEPWEDATEQVDGATLKSRGEQYTPLTLPDEIKFLTAGVDVQVDRLEFQVVGWSYYEEMYAVRYEILYGDPAQTAVWNQLDTLLLDTYQTNAGRHMRVRAACIDTGGHHANAVIGFCKPRRSRWIFPTKGSPGTRPLWPKRPSRTKDRRNEIWLIGVDTGKDALYGRLRIMKPGPGYLHLPIGQGFDGHYVEQLTSEQVVTRYREGRPYRVWVMKKQGQPNEALDTFVMAMAARHALPIRLDMPRLVHDAADAVPDRPASPPPPPPITEQKAEPALTVVPKPDKSRGLRRFVRRVSLSGYMR